MTYEFRWITLLFGRLNGLLATVALLVGFVITGGLLGWVAEHAGLGTTITAVVVLLMVGFAENGFRAWRDGEETQMVLARQLVAMREDRDDLRTKLGRRNEDQDFADLLTEKYRFGVTELLNGPIASEQEFAQLSEAIESWVAEVLDLMRGKPCTRQEITSVEYLREVPTHPQFKADPKRDHCLRMLNERLRRVMSVVNSYAERTTDHGW